MHQWNNDRWDKDERQFQRRFGVMAIIVLLENIAIIVGVFVLIAWIGQQMGLW